MVSVGNMVFPNVPHVPHFGGELWIKEFTAYGGTCTTGAAMKVKVIISIMVERVCLSAKNGAHMKILNVGLLLPGIKQNYQLTVLTQAEIMNR